MKLGGIEQQLNNDAEHDEYDEYKLSKLNKSEYIESKIEKLTQDP